MGSFCSSCGTALNGGAFCSGCGQAAAAPSVAPSAPAPQPPAPAPQPPAPPQHTAPFHTCVHCRTPTLIYCTHCGEKADAAVPPEGYLVCSACNQSFWAICIHCKQTQQYTPQAQPQPQGYQQSQPQTQQPAAGSSDAMEKAKDIFNKVKKSADVILTKGESKLKIHKLRLITAALALLGMLGTFMPWVSFSAFGQTLRYNAFSEAFSPLGWFVFIPLAAALVLCFVGNRAVPFGKLAIAPAICAAIAGLFTIGNIVSTGAEYGSLGMNVLGFGINFTAFMCVGVVAATVVGFVLALKKR